VEAIVEAIAGYFLRPGFGVKVGRFDLALDFQCEGWVWPEMEDVVCRAKKRDVDYESTTVTGMTFGKRHAPIQVQLYDKSREIRVHHKEAWMKSVWATKEAYSECLPVIRAELRFSRDLLRDFGMETIMDLSASAGDLVRHIVGDQKPWFRVASSASRHHKSNRREVDPLWKEICIAFLEGLPETGQVRQSSSSPGPDLKGACTRVLTHTIQIAAWHKLLGRNPAPSAEEYLGPVLLPYLADRLKADGFESFEEAVDFKAMEIVSSGKAF
jgi:hypothetical protein